MGGDCAFGADDLESRCTIKKEGSVMFRTNFKAQCRTGGNGCRGRDIPIGTDLFKGQRSRSDEIYCTIIREIAKHTPELCQLIMNAGGIGAVIDYIGETKGMVRLPGIAMLGYVAAHSETLAMAVIMSKGVSQLAIILSEEQEDRINAATVWALGQIGGHTPEHAKAIAVSNVLPRLLESYTSPESSEDLQTKSKAALKKILQKCVYLPALEPLLHDAPSNILQHVVAQYSKVLPHDPAARRLFVTSGGLKKVQEIKSEPETALCEYIREINTCFPEEIVRYYSPGYSEQLLQRVECFKPPDGCQTISVPDNLCKEGINTSPSQN